MVVEGTNEEREATKQTPNVKIWRKFHIVEGPKNKKISTSVQSITSLKEDTQLQLFKSDDFLWKLSNERNIRFWEEAWIEPGPLSTTHNRPYSLYSHKNISVAEMIASGPSITPDSTSHWRRALRGWEKTDYRELRESIASIRLEDILDKMVWKQTGEEYDSSTGYKITLMRIVMRYGSFFGNRKYHQRQNYSCGKHYITHSRL